jgi:peptidoglycan-associated lipoprotein
MACVRRPFSVFAVGVLLAVAAAGCHKKVPQQTAAVPGASGQAAMPAPLAVPPPPPSPAPPPAPAASVPSRLTDEDLFARRTLDDVNAEHPLADVFFDLDKSEIREDAKAPLSKDADWMKTWAGTTVMVEGHCDPRGSSEYNLALGSRRADAVKSYLVSLGVPADRLVVVSKGKEQPFCHDENDACWQQNRRGHFIVTSK